MDYAKIMVGLVRAITKTATTMQDKIITVNKAFGTVKIIF